MLRRIAVVGDELSAGGRILHYEGPIFSIGNSGRQVALIGGAAYCEACSSTGRIAKVGGPRRINFFTGETAAHGDIVLCNCATPPHIVAELAGEAWCDDEADVYAARQAEEEAARVAAREHAIHDEQYVLKSSDGRPIENMRYRIIIDDEHVMTGITNSSGETERVVTQRAASLRIQLEN